MGYTPTATTEVLTVYLTDAGRRDLVDGGGFSVQYFALGDTDITYTDTHGKVVVLPTRTTDLRGSTANCFSTASRDTIRIFIEK